MKAVVFYEHGTPEVLQVEDVEAPTPDRGEVAVNVHAAALNHLDLWIRRGIGIDMSYPHIGGSDVAGEIAELGEDVSSDERLSEGDRVLLNPVLWCGRCEWCLKGEHSLCQNVSILGEHTNGGFAERVVVPARNVHKIPKWMTFAQAAAVPLVYQTAWRALITQAQLKAGESVLITGASGGVASAGIQIANYAGACVFAVTKGGEMVRRATELGADVVYDRDIEDFSPRVWSDTGKRGVDVVLDSVGEAVWRGCLRALARGGRFVTYGATTGPHADTDIRLVFWKQLQIIGSTLSNASEFRQVLSLIFDGHLEPIIDRSFPLDELPEAHSYLERGAQFGKVIIEVDGG